MNIVNQIRGNHPDALEIFKVKGYEDVSYVLIHNPSNLLLLDLDKLQQICVFDDDASTYPLSDIAWGLSLSFLALIDYLGSNCIVSISPDDELRKIEDLVLMIIKSKKYLNLSIELLRDWKLALQGVFEEIWSKPQTLSYTKDTELLETLQVNQEGYIYVVELDSFVKVGFSRDVSKRMNQYRTSNLKVNIIKTFKGTIEQEKEFHKKHNGGSEKYFDTSINVVTSLKSFLKSIN